MTAAVAEALANGRARLAAAGIAAADLEARVLLEHASGLDRSALVSRGGDPVEPRAGERYERLLAGRSRRAPLAYLIGEREFWSLRLSVDPRVLVPRPETETLVEAALARLGQTPRVADVGTGSGAVAIALAVELPAAVFWAVDRSPAALDLARSNAGAHGVGDRIEFLAGDLAAPLAHLAGTLDAVVSNPPYVPSAEIERLEPEVRYHEPRIALDGGEDGLAVIARLIAQAPGALRPGGWLLLEVGAGQAGAAAALLRDAGAWDPAQTVRDLAGIERVVAAQKRG